MNATNLVTENHTTPNWDAVKDDVQCPLCSYNLRGLATPRCPECGYAFEWPDLLDPDKRKHPYLYEHHPDRSVWSFWRTVWGIRRPSTFWRTLHPAQPSVPSRLVRYGLIGVIGFLLLSMFFVLASDVIPALIYARRVHKSTLYPPYSLTPGKYLTWSESIDYVLDRMRFTSRYQRREFFFELLLPGKVVLGWLLGTFVGLSAYSITLNRAKLSRWHIVRCVFYSFDISTTVIIYAVGALFVMWLDRFQSISYRDTFGLPTFFVALGMLIGGYRLYVAYRMYLRFPNPLTVVLSSQVVAFLVTAMLFVPY